MAQRGGQPISSRREGLARLTRPANRAIVTSTAMAIMITTRQSEQNRGVMPATFAASDWLRRAAEMWAEAAAADDFRTKRLKMI